MKPKDRLPESQKDRKWRRERLEYCNTLRMNSFLRESDIKLLKLASGQLIETDYTFITNPHGLSDEKYKQYPAKLRNFDFIAPLFLRWISEYKQRIFEPIVYTKNSNFDNERLQYEKKLTEQSIQQRFINMLIQSGAFDPSQMDEAGNPVQEPMSPEVIKAKTTSLPDLKTIAGQHAIDYIRDKQELERKYRKAFEYFIKLNKCVTFKDVRRDEVMLTIVSPLDVHYFGGNNITFLEDAEVVKVDYYLTYEEVMEIIEDELEEYKEEYGDIAKTLENDYQALSGNPTEEMFWDVYRKNGSRGRAAHRSGVREDKKIKFTHVQFTSFRKVKKVLDENGEVLDLTEDYQGDDIIEEVWYPEEREGYIIGDRYFIGGYANDIQRVEVDNPYSTKKNYNGRIFLQGDVEQLTPVERLYQYQEAYNVTQFKIQSAINKDQGKIMTMPISLMQGIKDTGVSGNLNYSGNATEDGAPIYQLDGYQESKGEDSVIAKNMYYAQATGIMFLDDSDPQFVTAAQYGIKAIDMSLGPWIQYLDQRAQQIKFEAENLLGFNNARTGGISSTESVTNAQQNAYSGSLITEEYFSEFEEFLANDLQGILDLSKYAFRTGKKAHYVRSNMDVAVLAIDEGYSEASYGIFIRSSGKSKEVLDTLKAQATQLLQNFPGKATSLVAKILSNSNNYASIIQEIEAKEEEFMQAEQANQQADRDNAMQIEQSKEASKQADRDLKKYEIDSRAEVEIAKSGLMSAGFNIGKEGGDDIAASLLTETNKLIDNIQKNNLKAAEIKSKEKIADQTNKTKLEVANKQLQVAKTNPG